MNKVSFSSFPKTKVSSLWHPDVSYQGAVVIVKVMTYVDLSNDEEWYKLLSCAHANMNLVFQFPTDLMVVFIESHLDIKANKLRQVPVRVAVLSAENFKLEYKTLTHDQDNWKGKWRAYRKVQSFVVLPEPIVKTLSKSAQSTICLYSWGDWARYAFPRSCQRKNDFDKRLGRKLKDWQNFLDQTFLRP